MLQDKGLATSDKVADAIRRCLSEICVDGVKIEKLSCSTVNRQRHTVGGLYVFVDDNGNVLYVGQAGNLYRRIRGEHCNASIGASEGVVRFLMHTLTDICRDPQVAKARDAVTRERLVKRFLRNYIGTLTIYVAYCKTQGLDGNIGTDRAHRLQAEECLKKMLNPLLNPIIT